MHEDIKDWFEAFENKLPKNAVYETFDKDHGRLERRKYALLTDIKWLEQRNEWKGLKAVGMVRATVEEKCSKTAAVRYFITSLTDVDFFLAGKSTGEYQNTLQ